MYFDNWESEICHYGTRGMKHGRRLYQNPDGSLTALGRIHYGIKERQAKSDSSQVKIFTANLESEQKHRQKRADRYERKLNKKIVKMQQKLDKAKKAVDEITQMKVAYSAMPKARQIDLAHIFNNMDDFPTLSQIVLASHG